MTILQNTIIYEATGNAVNNVIYGFMGTVSGNDGFNISSIKDDFSEIDYSIFTGSSSKSKAVKATSIEVFEPSDNPNYVEGFH